MMESDSGGRGWTRAASVFLPVFEPLEKRRASSAELEGCSREKI